MESEEAGLARVLKPALRPSKEGSIDATANLK